MGKLILRLPKGENIQTVAAHLQADLPEYEVSLYGVIGKGIKVSGGLFAGARVMLSPVGRLVGVKAQPASVLAAMLDSLTFGLLGMLGGSGRVRKTVRESVGRMIDGNPKQ